MKKILLVLTLITLLGTMNVSAQANTFSSELSETKYYWEVTAASSDVSWETGDHFEYELEQAPAGLTYEEYLNLGIIIEVNGDELDLNEGMDTYTEFEQLAVIWILIWAVPSPSTVFTTDNGYTIDGTEATDDLGYTYSTSSGLLLKLDDGAGNVIEYDEDGPSLLPINPIFALLGLLAIPVINRYRR